MRGSGGYNIEAPGGWLGLDRKWPFSNAGDVLALKLERMKHPRGHIRAIAMRAAWCARQSPKAWPKRLAPGESAYNLAAPGAWLGLDRVPR